MSMQIHPQLQAVLNQPFWNNTGMDYAVAIAIFLSSIILLLLLKKYIITRLQKLAKKTKTEIDDMVIDFFQGIRWQFYAFIGLYIAIMTLTLPPVVGTIMKWMLVIAVGYYAAVAAAKVVDCIVSRRAEAAKRENVADDASAILIIGKLAKVGIFILAFLLILSNLGVNINSLIAGLGIGGIAVAFALQSILEDLFSSFSIYFDKPFKPGDFIIVGSDTGVVRHIGLKTTRLQTLQGQELVISNKELTSSRINNFKKMEERRVVFAIGVEYSTSSAKLKSIPQIIRDIIKEIKGTRLDRVHFKAFGDFSLNFEVVYYVLDSDYIKYMDIQQDINLKIRERFEKARIVMAFPTQTIHLAK
ncbi:TPA: mechanosensitive ion channel family protein [Candidatus Woesearchaeota archaeon]|nr:mechanosensitive ion channel family protein [Candidatus Woesearchaeota archaeon]